MNKGASYAGFVLTIIGSTLLVIAATTLSPYQTDYIGIIAGVVLTAFGLTVALAGAIQPRFEHSTRYACSARHRLLAEAKVTIAPHRSRHLEARKQAQRRDPRPLPLARHTKIPSLNQEAEASIVSLPPTMFDTPSSESPMVPKSPRARPKRSNRQTVRRSAS